MLKKSLSVFLAVLMMLTACTVGFMGLAAEIDYDIQYEALANALSNEHVRTLTNYTITNQTLQNGADGFDTDANGFAYEHRITADDDSKGSILKAANIFYYISEHILSTQYGVGYYSPSLLLNHVIEKVKPYFGGDETSYVDFYGNRYEPTAEELEAYNNAVSQIEASGAEVTQGNLTQLRIHFIEKNNYQYYNVETILKYFLGNTTSVNNGNWYHRYVFVVNTSKNTAVKELGDITNYADTSFKTRVAVYEWDYVRTFNDTQTKAYYAFKAPSSSRVWTNYGVEFSLNKASDNLMYDDMGNDYITPTGQASAFLINERLDETTIPELSTIYNAFAAKITKTGAEASWDGKYALKSDADIIADPTNEQLVNYFTELTSEYSNDALLSVFGENIGNIVTAAYLFMPTSKMPARTLYDDTTELTPESLDEIIYDLDGLVTPREGTDNARDQLVAGKVATVVSMFFDTTNELFEGTSIYGMEYSTLHELVGFLAQGLLFRDSIVSLLVGLLYPLITDLLQENVYDAVIDAVGDGISGLAEGLINNIIENNELAIHPASLAKFLREDEEFKDNCVKGGKWYETCEVLSSHGDDWYVRNPNDEDYGTEDYKGNVNWTEDLDWGVDAAPLGAEKADAFTEALCGGLGGFIRLLVTVMCGDAEYTYQAGLSYDDKQYNEYFDKLLINLLGVTGWLRSQGGYTKVIIPLFRVLGLSEQTTYSGKCYGYVTSELYNKLCSESYSNSLRLIVQPIVYWATDILGTHPFTTLMQLLPNLVYFFIRQGRVDANGNIEGYENSLSGYISQWEGDGKYDKNHGPFAAVQTFNLLDILSTVNINITIDWKILGGTVNTWAIPVGSLKSLIDKDEMLGSVNGLLNEVLSLDYKTGIVEEVRAAGYSDPATGEVVPADSDEYAYDFESENPRFTQEELVYYSDHGETSFSLTKDEDHPDEHRNLKYKSVPYKIPAIPEAKLASCGPVNTAWNTIDVNNPGKVFLFLLRYVISALGYRYDNEIMFEDVLKDENGDPMYDENGVAITDYVHLPYLIECFGLNINSELFQGLNLKDIIFNVMLHPDEAIWSLLELFYSHETGNEYMDKQHRFKTDSESPHKNLAIVDYHKDVLLNESINPGLLYGTKVKYTQYWTQEYAADVVGNADEFVTNILMMIGMTDFKDGLGKYLENMLNDKVFTNDLLNTLFNAIYQLLGGLNESVGIDLEGILDAALDVSYSTDTVADALVNMLGYETEAYRAIKEAGSWEILFTVGTEEVDGEEVPVSGDVDLDWGLDDITDGMEKATVFCKTVSALVSPVAFALRFLFLDEALDLLSLVKLPSYPGYKYALIPLLEALSCPNVLTYDEYYEKCHDPVNGPSNTIYYILSPILGLLEKVYTQPVDTVLSMLPNLLFVISVGGLNDILNNLIHFAYVLVDILSPIVNAYDLLGGLLSNLEISGVSINISIPLDIDFNGLASDLLGALVGDAIQIEGVSISLPYIDFHTLCCGTLSHFESKQGETTAHLDAAGGGDMITALLRIVFETLFMEENEAAIAQIVANAADNGSIDGYDKETIVMLIDELFSLIQKYEVLDMVLFVVYFLVNNLTPISGTLAARLSAAGLTIPSLFEGITDVNSFISKIMLLVDIDTNVNEDGTTTDEQTGTLSGFGSLFARIKAFFQKLIQFFKNLFN